MGDTLITVVAISLAAILMFVFPLMTMADRADSASQLTIQQATTDFVEKASTTAKITKANYDVFIQKITSTGNTYDVELTVQIRDSNLGKKASLAQPDKIGENVYFTEYTGQILNELDANGTYYCKEGDIITAAVKNNNLTISDQLKNFFYTVTGNNTASIVAEHTAMVTANGK